MVRPHPSGLCCNSLAVITSYSIHYTKLYEVQRDPAGLRESLILLLGLGPTGWGQVTRLLADAPYPAPQLIPILEALPDSYNFV